MKGKFWLLALLEGVIWYFFFLYLLYSIKNPVDIAVSALVLLVLVYLAMLACPVLECPWINRMRPWKTMWKKKKK
jgi:hypothetical protein